MTKKFLRKLSMILVAALLVTSCPLSTFAIEESDLNMITDAAETPQDQLLETAEEATGSNDADTAITENIIKIDTEESATDDDAATDVTADDATEDDASPSEATPVELTSDPVDGVIVTVTAPAGAFPDGVKLVVNKVGENNSDLQDIEAAVDNAKLIEAAQSETASDDATSERFTFDIKVVDADGNEVQPTADVQVKFALADSVKPIADANVYHLEENNAVRAAQQQNELDKALSEYSDEETNVAVVEDTDDTDYSYLDGDVIDDLGESDTDKSTNFAQEEDDYEVEDAETEVASGDTEIKSTELKESSLIAKLLETTVDEETLQEVEIETEGFSYYVVEFFYKTYKYVLAGDDEVELSTILNALEINIDPSTITKVEVSDDSLFVAEKRTNGDDSTWIVKSLKAFSTEEWMKVYVGDVVYEVKVTDEETNTIATISSEDEFVTACNSTTDGKYILGNAIIISGEYKKGIKINNRMVIDLNGFAIECKTGGSEWINVEKEFTIKDTSSYSSGNIKLEMVVQEECAVILNSGVLGSSIDNSGEVTANGGIIEGTIQNDGMLTIRGSQLEGNIENGELIKKTEYTGVISIVSGNIISDITNQYGTITISGGCIKKSINNSSEDNNKIIITDGTFDVTPIGEKDYFDITGGSFKYSDVSSLLKDDYEAVQSPKTGYYVVQYKTNVPSVRIGDNTYLSLELALASANSGDTLVFLRNLIYEGWNGVQVTKDVTLDFNGYTYKGWMSIGEYKTSGLSLTGDGTKCDVKIIGSSTASEIALEIVNGSELTIQSGTFTSNAVLGSSAFISLYRSSNDKAGRLIINGGTYNGKIANKDGYVEFNGGYFVGNIENFGSKADTLINGGTFKGEYGFSSREDVAFSLTEGGFLSITSGIINGSIVSQSNGEVCLYYATVVGGVIAYHTSQIDIYGGTYTLNRSNDLYATGDAKITLHGGKYWESSTSGSTDEVFVHKGYVDTNNCVATHLKEESIDGSNGHWWLVGTKEDENDPEAEVIRNGMTLATGSLALMVCKADTKDDTIRLLKNIYDPDGEKKESFVLTSGVTLDLNGKELNALNINASLGHLIDSVTDPNTMGCVKAHNKLAFNSLNEYLPLYDSNVGAYRLFAYTINTSFGQDADHTYVKSQYKLLFEGNNAQYAYSLLAGGDSKLGIKGYLAWHNRNGKEIEGSFQYNADDLIASYGSRRKSGEEVVFFIMLKNIETYAEHWRIIKTRPELTVEGITGEFTYTGSPTGVLTKYAKLSTPSGASYSNEDAYKNDTEPW